MYTPVYPEPLSMTTICALPDVRQATTKSTAAQMVVVFRVQIGSYPTPEAG